MSESQTHHLFKQIADELQRDTGEHLYRQIGTLIRQRIERGDLKPGDALPPQRELCRLIQTSEVTVRRALQELADEGLIDAHVGRGTLVLARKGAAESKSSTSLTIGIAFASLTDGYPFFRPLLEGLRSAIDREINVRLFDLPGGTNGKDVDLAGIDGLIMMSPVNLQLLARCQQLRLPCVLLYTDIADGFSHCILVDYMAGVMEAVGHLKQSGRDRIALVTAGDERFSTGQLEDAYRLALQLNALPFEPAWLRKAGYHEKDGHRAMQSLLALPQRPDAVLFASDYQARGALLAAHAAGVEVPSDIAIIGAGRVLGESGWPVPLTTIDLHFDEVGRVAARTLDAITRGAPVPHRQKLASTLVIGHTG